MAQQVRRELGEFLVESNLITRAQLNEARGVQRDSGERLGRVLIKLGYAREQDIVNALEFQLGITRVELYDHNPDPQIMKLIPEAIARRHKVVPLKHEGNTIKVAMADPLNLVALDDLRLATGLEIIPSLADESEIDRILERYYDLRELVNEASAQFDTNQGPLAVEKYDLDDVAAADAQAAPIVKLVNTIIQRAMKERASDIHIEPMEQTVRVRLRVDGLMREAMQVPRRFLPPTVSRIKIMAEMNIAERRLPQDGRVQIRVGGRSADLRISTLPSIFGEKVVIRLLDQSSTLLKIADLGFEAGMLQRYHQLISRPHGMILVTGPTGSGKTTTLYATLNETSTDEVNTITVEDPVEYVLSGITQVQVNPKAGLTFAAALRSILRQDPDIIMVGEIRDTETADMAIRAATTGHLVFSTLHTTSAVATISRLLEMGVEPYLVASSISGVLAQRLARRICPHCREPITLPPDSLERHILGVPPGADCVVYHGRGCTSCERSGYRGRLGIHELMLFSPAMRALIVHRAPADEIQHLAVAEGMKTLKLDIVQKALDGLTTTDEVKRLTYGEFDSGGGD